MSGGPQPVEIQIVRGCQFKQKPCKACGLPKSNKAHAPGGACAGYKRQLGCDRCGANKGDAIHYGAPPSLNVLASGQGSGNAMVYAGHKKAWQALIYEQLVESALPKGLSRVYVEGEITFPDAGRRDQGNYRVLIEKALGDALVTGGWLADDDWDHYEFGGLVKRVQRGESATRLMLFPTALQQHAEFTHDGEQMELR